MSSILKKPSFKAHLPHYGHDMSRRVLFTSSVGHIIPVMFDYLDGGDTAYIKANLFTRTQPLKTPAFVRCTEHIYYFFVPISQIDSYHGQAKYGINDFVNSNDINTTINSGSNPTFSVPVTRPTIAYGDLFQQFFGSGAAYGAQSFYATTFDSSNPSNRSIVRSFSTDPLLDRFGVPAAWNALRLLDMLGYSSRWIQNSFGATKENTILSTLGFNPNLLACYQKIWYDYFRLSSWESSAPYVYNLNQYIKAGSFADALKLIGTASTGAGDRESPAGSLFTMRYHPLKKDFFTSIEPTPLFDPLGDTSYNFGVGHSDNISLINSMFLSAFGIQLQDINNNLTTRQNEGVFLDEQKYATTFRDYTDGGDRAPMGYNSVQQLRLAYAYDRLLSITQRAGKHYDDQVRAHLGVSIPQGVSDEVYYIGCQSSNLMIGEVVSQSAGNDGSGSTSVLGELAGRGLGASRSRQKGFKFRAPDDGYIMALYCCVPDVDYVDFGIDKLNLYRSIMDWPRPEFDRLGMQPLYVLQSNADYIGAQTSPSINSITGWQYRWSELKLSYDVVHGAFLHTLNDWTSAITFGEFGSLVDSLYCPPTYLDGLFALSFKPVKETIQLSNPAEGAPVMSAEGYVLSSNEIQGTYKTYADDAVSGSAGESTLYALVGSSLANTTVPDEAWSSSVLYSRDPLLHSIDFTYRKRSWMSTYGLPNL